MADRRRSFELQCLSRDPLATVISVQKIAGNNLKWTFNTLVTSDGNPSTTLQDSSLSSNAIPIGTTQNGTNAVTCLYAATPAVNDTWSFGSPPNHLTSPGGFGPNQGGLVT
jgi:hypothetical protein